MNEPAASWQARVDEIWARAQGRAGEAAGLLLSALGPRLSRYQRSVTQQAQEWALRRGRCEMKPAQVAPSASYGADGSYKQRVSDST